MATKNSKKTLNSWYLERIAKIDKKHHALLNLENDFYYNAGKENLPNLPKEIVLFD